MTDNEFSVVFNNFDLSTIPYVILSNRNPNNEPDLSISKFDLVRRDGGVITSVKHEPKRIELEGYIVSPSRISFEEAFDELKFRTSAIEKVLAIVQGGSIRKYTVTKENIILEHIEAGKARFSISFLSSQPFGKDATLTNVSYNETTSPASLPHVFQGTALVMPLFTVTINSVTGGAVKYVAIGNSTTGQQVQVVRTWTAGDVVQFDIENKRVFVNAQVSDYDGVFPLFTPQQGNCYYVDSFTDRNVTIGISYVKQYL